MIEMSLQVYDAVFFIRVTLYQKMDHQYKYVLRDISRSWAISLLPVV